jgi:D-alanyl-D-alanine dipeptidase
MRFKKIFILLFFVFASHCFAQNTTPELIEVNKLNPNIVLDIRYATTNNFTGKIVYPEARCFLVKDAALSLDSVQKDLEKIGLGLKIYDGYRPLSVQKKFWEILPDERYVADPKKGSRHNRGMAVDLTLVDNTGKELSMPTEYDDFSEKAHRDYMSLTDEQIKNRKIQEDVMVKYGFVPFATEWWHFDYKGWEDYKVLDVDFKDIK